MEIIQIYPFNLIYNYSFFWKWFGSWPFPNKLPHVATISHHIFHTFQSVHAPYLFPFGERLWFFDALITYSESKDITQFLMESIKNYKDVEFVVKCSAILHLYE